MVVNLVVGHVLTCRAGLVAMYVYTWLLALGFCLPLFPPPSLLLLPLRLSLDFPLLFHWFFYRRSLLVATRAFFLLRIHDRRYIEVLESGFFFFSRVSFWFLLVCGLCWWRGADGHGGFGLSTYAEGRARKDGLAKSARIVV